MAGQADGSVIIDTQFDQQGFAAGSKEMRQAIKSLNSQVETLGTTMKNAVSGSVNAISQFNSKAETLRETIAQDEEKLKALGEQRLPTDDYTRICTEAEKAGQALEKLLTKQERWEESGKKQSGIGWTTLQADLNQASTLYDRLIAKKKELEQTGQAYQMGSNTAEYAQLASNLEAAKQRLAEMQSEVDSVSQKMNQPITLSGMIKNAFTSAGAAIKSAFSSVGTAVTHPLQTIGGALGTIATRAAQAASSLAKMAGNAIVNGLKKITSRIKQAASSLLGLNKSASKASGGLSGGLKTMLKYGLGVRSLYALVNKLRSALVDGFQNLAQYSDSTNSAISSLKTSLTTLKNSFAAAFSPILTTVAPILTKLINLLSTAVSHVGAFFAALTGSKTYTKAVAVQEDYAASLSGTASAADDAADAAKEAKRQLAGFDELNILADNSSSSSGSGSGSNASSMFEEEEIPSGISDLAESLKELFANGEFVEIGETIASGLNSALQSVDDWINNTFRPMGVMWAENIANVLNGLVDGLDWNLLGKTVSDGINSVFDILNTFLTTFDFVSFGEGIGEGLAGAIKNLDTESIGSVLAYKVKGLLDSAAGLVNSFSDSGGWTAIGEKLAGYVNGWFDTIWSIDWASVGNAIGNVITGIPETIISFLQNVDWKGHAEGLSSSISGLLSGLAEKFENYDWRPLAGDLVTSIVTAIMDFFGNIDWGGIVSSAAELIGAFIRGVALAVVGLGETLWNDYILPAWNSLVDWWNDTAFEDGQFTIEGLLGGILDALVGAVASIGEWIFTYIVDPFMSAILGEDTWSDIKDAGKNIIEGLFNGIKEFFSDPLGWIKEHIFQPFINAFKSLFGIHSPSTVMEEQGGYIVDGLLNGITNLASSITAIPGKIKEWISEKFSDAKDWLKEKGTNIITGVKNGMEGAKNLVQDVAGSIKGWVTDKVSSVSSWLKDKGKDVISGMKSGMEGNKSLLSDAASSVKSWVTDKLSNWSDAKTWGSDLCSNLANGISGAVDTVKKAASSVADKVKSFLGFSEPEEGPLSNFHTYMPDMIKLMVNGIKDNEDMAIDAVSDMADAIADEMNDGSYTLTEIVPATEVNGAIESFTDKITDSFSSMLDKLQAIAESVTFTVPSVVTGVVPYKAAATAASGRSSTNMDATPDTIKQAVAEVLGDFISSNVAGHEATVAVLEQILDAVLGIEIGPETVAEMVNNYNHKMAIVRGRT